MRISQDNYRILVSLLIVTGLVLMYSIFKNDGSPTAPLSSRTTMGGGNGNMMRSTDSSALNAPGPNASPEERQKHFDLAVGLAQKSTDLDLTDCTASPVVLEAKQGASIMVRNRGDAAVTLAINRDHIVKIPAQQSTPLTIDFGNGPGLYGYGCNAGDTAVGLFLVTR